MTKNDDPVVLLVELDGGDTVAVAFTSSDKADTWADVHQYAYEVVGRARIVSSRSLTDAARATQPSPVSSVVAGRYDPSN